MIKRVRIPTENKSPTNHLRLKKKSSTNHLWLKRITHKSPLPKGDQFLLPTLGLESAQPDQEHGDISKDPRDPQSGGDLLQLMLTTTRTRAALKSTDTPRSTQQRATTPISASLSSHSRGGRAGVLNSSWPDTWREVQLPSFHVYQEENGVDFADFWSCFHSQCYSQPILKCNLNNAPFLISLREFKWFCQTQPRNPCLSTQLGAEGNVNFCKWQCTAGREFNSDQGHLGFGLAAVRPLWAN